MCTHTINSVGGQAVIFPVSLRFWVKHFDIGKTEEKLENTKKCWGQGRNGVKGVRVNVEGSQQNGEKKINS